MSDLSFFYFDMTKNRTIVWVAAAALLLAACHHEGLPQGVIDEARMTDFLTEAYQLEGFYAVETQYRYDSLPDAVVQRYDSLLEAQDLSREQVEQSLDYYSQHLDAYQRIHDSVVVRLEARRAALPPIQAPVDLNLPTADSLHRTLPKLVLGK